MTEDKKKAGDSDRVFLSILAIFVILLAVSIMTDAAAHRTALLSTTGNDIVYSGSFGISVFSLLGILLIALMLFDIVLLLFGSRPVFTKGSYQQKKKGGIAQNIALSILFLFIVIAFLYIYGGDFSSGGGLSRSSRISSLNSTSPLQGINFGTSSLDQAAGPIIIAGVVLTAVLIILTVLTAVRVAEEPERKEMLKTETDELKKGVYEVTTSDDPKNAILEMYRKLCDLLVSSGARNRPEWTAREFESEARSILGLHDSQLTELTLLFEEAKYSTHQMGKEERRKAAEILERVVSSVISGRGEGTD